MQTTQGQMLQSLRAVQAFLDQHAEILAGVVKTGSRQQLSDAIAALAGHLSDQTGHHLAAQGATKKQRVLRRALVRDHMSAIVRIARVNIPATPQIEAFKMPRGKPTAAQLAGLAHGMADAAIPYTDVFVRAGLPVGFIDQLHKAADAMIGAIDERSTSRGNRGGATRSLKAKLTDGRKIVHVLDAFVRTALRDDPGLLANWNIVKRVQRNTGGVRPSTDASASPPPTGAPDTPAAPTELPAPPTELPAPPTNPSPEQIAS